MAILRQPINEQATTREDYPPVPLGTIVGVEVSETEPTNPLTEIWIKPSEGNQDFVVDYGTDGVWTWRKWNSGIAECLGEFDYTANLSTTTGNYFTQSATGTAKNFPTNLFVSAPIVRPIVRSSTYLNVTPATVTKDNFTLNLFGGYKYTGATVKIHTHAIGNWK